MKILNRIYLYSNFQKQKIRNSFLWTTETIDSELQSILEQFFPTPPPPFFIKLESQNIPLLLSGLTYFTMFFFSFLPVSTLVSILKLNRTIMYLRFSEHSYSYGLILRECNKTFVLCYSIQLHYIFHAIRHWHWQ